MSKAHRVKPPTATNFVAEANIVRAGTVTIVRIQRAEGWAIVRNCHCHTPMPAQPPEVPLPQRVRLFSVLPIAVQRAAYLWPTNKTPWRKWVFLPTATRNPTPPESAESLQLDESEERESRSSGRRGMVFDRDPRAS